MELNKVIKYMEKIKNIFLQIFTEPRKYKIEQIKICVVT